MKEKIGENYCVLSLVDYYPKFTRGNGERI